ncbi:MAG: LPS assembly lipoprotein LptE [Candidatus Competibacteraceae bacterium]
MNAPNNTLHWLVLGLLMSMLAGCGFQLRGQADLPPEMAVTYINTGRSPTAPPSPLGFALRQALEANGIMVTTDPAQAQANLVVLREDVRRRTLAAGPRGETREYTLTYTVDYTVTLADGSSLLDRESVSLSRDLLYAESDVLGREAGEDIILNDLRADIACSICCACRSPPVHEAARLSNWPPIWLNR